MIIWPCFKGHNDHNKQIIYCLVHGIFQLCVGLSVISWLEIPLQYFCFLTNFLFPCIASIYLFKMIVFCLSTSIYLKLLSLSYILLYFPTCFKLRIICIYSYVDIECLLLLCVEWILQQRNCKAHFYFCTQGNVFDPCLCSWSSQGPQGCFMLLL